ncbi:Coatomer/clathrin adaptor appendage, Ig-like subdomain [Pseudocohnilembus persalinus]|uniref:Coatomer/clathrin adaptor appendage, Ig-like subdomain n=1 Tax=Pseudocohnilembus persalinus TaxID=266149 RepID=A0A0V0QE80_PSEPJ|nr:Coatomer/clathrin adaptor appendage, Ig-like subdomain [Pseudocohnilembus persalinus]|eukprot:KRX00517.1 Coatomer/clathrin adaptor appendage, Ig-like subdomain [Pseudocohnilembus persalinus]
MSKPAAQIDEQEVAKIQNQIELAVQDQIEFLTQSENFKQKVENPTKETFIAKAVVKDHELLILLQSTAQHDNENKDPHRGKTLFPGFQDPESISFAQNFFQLLLELIEIWAEKYQNTPSGKDSKFMQMYKNLKQKRVTFPKVYEMLPELIPKSKQSQQQQQQSQKQSQKESTTPNPDQASQKQQQMHQQMKQIEDDLLNELDQFFNQFEKNLDNLVTSLNNSTSLSNSIKSALELKNNDFANYRQEINLLQEQIMSIGPQVVGEEDLNFLKQYDKVCQTYNKEYANFQGKEQNLEQYIIFKNKILKLCEGLTTANIQLQELPKQEISQSVKQQQEVNKSQQTKKPELKSVSFSKDVESKQQKSDDFGGWKDFSDKPFDDQKDQGSQQQKKSDFGNFGDFGSQNEQQKQQQESQFGNEFKDDKKFSQREEAKEEKQQFSKNQNEQQSHDTNQYYQSQSQYTDPQQKEKERYDQYQSQKQEPQLQQLKKPEIQTQYQQQQQQQQVNQSGNFHFPSYAKQDFEDAEDFYKAKQLSDQNNKSYNPNQGSYFNQSHATNTKSEYRQAPQQQQQQYFQKNMDNSNERQQKMTRYQLQQEQKMNQFGDFQENFSSYTMSVLSATSEVFPMKNKQIIDERIYEGRQINYDTTIQDLVESSGLNPSTIRKFKMSNLKTKSVLLDTKEVQFGVKTQLIFDYLSSRNHLLVQIFIGNKTQEPIQDISLEFFGDHTSELWKKQSSDIDSVLPAGKQQKLEFMVQYNNCPYDLINGEFQALIQNTKEAQQKFFIPMLLTKFMIFKETDPFVFKSKWNMKKDQAIKTEFFTVNTRIVRQPNDFIKFFQKSIEFTSVQEFLSQKQQVNGEELKYYEVGGIFELNTPDIEFLLKITVRPNLTAIIQIIPFSSYIRIAEHVLHHLQYVFSK